MSDVAPDPLAAAVTSEADAPGGRDALVPATPAVDAVLDVLAAGSRSFSFAGAFLPPAQRQDAALLYAFCRHVDDVADDAASASAARAALARLAAEVRGDRPARPLIAAVLALFARRGIDRRHALGLIAGVRSDLDPVRVANDGELVRYGYHVASTVGLMMSGVIGVTDPEAPPFAVDLGVAMQITNICRDVREDAENGRVYLPATRLTAVGCPPTPEGVLAHRDAVQHVVLDLLSVADRYYRSAEAGMRFIPWRPRLAILIAARVYRAIGVRLAAAGGDALAGRTVVPFLGKVFAALGAILAFPGVSRRVVRHRRALHRALADLPGADVRATGE